MEKGNISLNRLSFIMSSIGASIGLGIIWIFPFKLARYGSSAFLNNVFFIFSCIRRCGTYSKIYIWKSV